MTDEKPLPRRPSASNHNYLFLIRSSRHSGNCAAAPLVAPEPAVALVLRRPLRAGACLVAAIKPAIALVLPDATTTVMNLSDHAHRRSAWTTIGSADHPLPQGCGRRRSRGMPLPPRSPELDPSSGSGRIFASTTGRCGSWPIATPSWRLPCSRNRLAARPAGLFWRAGLMALPVGKGSGRARATAKRHRVTPAAAERASLERMIARGKHPCAAGPDPERRYGLVLPCDGGGCRGDWPLAPSGCQRRFVAFPRRFSLASGSRGRVGDRPMGPTGAETLPAGLPPHLTAGAGRRPACPVRASPA